MSVSWNVAFIVAVQLPAVNKASRYFHSMEYNLARDENERMLNPYQHAYLLLDNGRDKPLDCAHDFHKQFDHYLSSIKTHGNGMSTNTDCIQYIQEEISTTYNSVKCYWIFKTRNFNCLYRLWSSTVRHRAKFHHSR